ncbi:hypothetical protein ACCUM_0137 [Candidatus Accumulibacter phosphatis]|uniref:Uncharacterized protein n=1 Tax=Candidatus Accumulibacter phosphatis TaxID=327160 RepID=A0A5S4EL68_9PROT|nr:hypothetical protein ACCUM_0137 [Candidatus Accumulibacter phosphatis]
MRLHKHITRAAAFWHHVEFVLSANCCRTPFPQSRHLSDRCSSRPAV